MKTIKQMNYTSMLRNQVKRMSCILLREYCTSKLRLRDDTFANVKDKEINNFLLNFYLQYEKELDTDLLNKDVSFKYMDQVCSLLNNVKNKEDLNELREIQEKIEEETMNFDEESIYKTAGNLLKILIDKERQCAKDYLQERLVDEDDKKMLLLFGHYTIEYSMLSCTL